MPVGALALGQDLVVTAGSWERTGTLARFAPRFAPVPGTVYAVLSMQDHRGSGWQELTRVVVPAAERDATAVVLEIGPGTESIPANLLRFSVTFSTPMEQGSAAGRIHLLDETGAELPGSLLEMPPELWDREGRRLTVLVEPGRLKRGLQPNVQAGAPMREGSGVILRVDSAVRDAQGAPLAQEAPREYRVGPPVRARVNPALWEIEWPGQRGERVVVRFDRPLDRALVLRCLHAVDETGRGLLGRVSLDPASSIWAFTPSDGQAVRALHVETRLEDLAGNSVRRVFDRDLTLADDDGVEDPVVVLTPAETAEG